MTDKELDIAYTKAINTLTASETSVQTHPNHLLYYSNFFSPLDFSQNIYCIKNNQSAKIEDYQVQQRPEPNFIYLGNSMFVDESFTLCSHNRKILEMYISKYEPKLKKTDQPASLQIGETKSQTIPTTNPKSTTLNSTTQPTALNSTSQPTTSEKWYALGLDATEPIEILQKPDSLIQGNYRNLFEDKTKTLYSPDQEMLKEFNIFKSTNGIIERETDPRILGQINNFYKSTKIENKTFGIKPVNTIQATLDNKDDSVFTFGNSFYFSKNYNNLKNQV